MRWKAIIMVTIIIKYYIKQTYHGINLEDDEILKKIFWIRWGYKDIEAMVHDLNMLIV